MAELTVESIQQQIPYYLTKEDKEGLAKALADWPNNFQFYCNAHPGDMLQGDGWTHFPIRNFENGETAIVNGLVLSNTCDISKENKRALPPKVLIAPLIPVRRYEELLRKAGLEEQSIGDTLRAIRLQRVTNIFYLPSVPHLGDEHLVLLDDVYSVPSAVIELGRKNRKIFTLQMAGFYLFILKLSVHFCRLTEGVPRKHNVMHT